MNVCVSVYVSVSVPVSACVYSPLFTHGVGFFVLCLVPVPVPVHVHVSVSAPASASASASCPWHATTGGYNMHGVCVASSYGCSGWRVGHYKQERV